MFDFFRTNFNSTKETILGKQEIQIAAFFGKPNQNEMQLTKEIKALHFIPRA